MATTHYTPTEMPFVSRSKKNTTGGTLSKGTAVKLKTTANDEILACAADGDVFYGIVREDILDGAWGDIMVIGKAVVLAGGTFTQGVQLKASTGGKLIAWTAASGAVAHIAGVSERDGAADTLTEAWINGPGNMAQAA